MTVEDLLIELQGYNSDLDIKILTHDENGVPWYTDLTIEFDPTLDVVFITKED